MFQGTLKEYKTSDEWNFCWNRDLSSNYGAVEETTNEKLEITIPVRLDTIKKKKKQKTCHEQCRTEEPSFIVQGNGKDCIHFSKQKSRNLISILFRIQVYVQHEFIEHSEEAAGFSYFFLCCS